MITLLAGRQWASAADHNGSRPRTVNRIVHSPLIALALAASGVAGMVSAFAADAADSTVTLDKYEVSDTKTDGLINKTIFRTDEEAPLPYNVLDRTEIERLGATSLEELFRNVSEATNYGNVLQSAVSNPGVSGGQTYSTAAVNLRGFGTTQTVVLINGRRLGPGSNVGGPDISRIPIGSIDRIEILPEAAAAIYGGGAIGGVINIILRKDYAARDITTYFGTSTEGGGTEFRVTLLDGVTRNGGRTKITTTLDYSTRKSVFMADRDYLQRALAKYGPDTPYRSTTGVSLFETSTLLAFAGMPGTIRISNATGGLNIPGNTSVRYAAIPAGLDLSQASALTPASFTATAGKANLQPRYNRSVLYRPQDNYSVQVQLEHAFIPKRLEFYLESNVAFQRQNYSFPQYNLISLSATHPLNPFRTGVTPGFVGVPITINLDTPDIRDPSSLQERNDARLTLGFKGSLNDRWDWTFDVSGQYQRLYSEGYNPQNYLSSFLTVLGKADSATATAPTSVAERWAIWNPFVDHTKYPISAATESTYFYYRRDNAFYNWNEQAAFRIVGDVFDLPAGAIRVSPGAELRFNEQRGQQFIPVSPAMLAALGSTPYVGYYSPSTETTRAAYLETRIPVLSRRWRPIPVEGAEIDVSRRWEQSNHARNTITSTLSGSVTLIKDILLRASYTEGFNPLSASYLVSPTITTDYQTTITDPRRGNTATPVSVPTYISGGNPLLRTEFARSKSVGTVLKPRFIKGLTLTVGYFETKRFDTVSTPAVADVLNYPGDYPGRIERAALTAGDQAAGYTAGAITKLDLSYINLTSLNQNGFDYRLNYRLPVRESTWGSLVWSLSTTNYNQYKQKTRPSSTAISYVDVQSYALRWRGNSNITWQKNGWLAGVTVRYTNPYSTSTTAPTPAYPTASGVDGSKIPSSTLFDVQLGYSIPAGARSATGWQRWLAGTEYKVGVLNVFDRDPPFYTDNYGFYSRYDDPRQRFAYVQIKKSL